MSQRNHLTLTASKQPERGIHLLGDVFGRLRATAQLQSSDGEEVRVRDDPRRGRVERGFDFAEFGGWWGEVQGAICRTRVSLAGTMPLGCGERSGRFGRGTYIKQRRTSWMGRTPSLLSS